MPAADHLRLTLRLDRLDEDAATYAGPSGAARPNVSAVTIDRASFEAEGRPMAVTLVLGEDES